MKGIENWDGHCDWLVVKTWPSGLEREGDDNGARYGGGV